MILPTEHAMINALHDHLSSVPIGSHRFVRNMKQKAKDIPFINLTPGQKAYIVSLHTALVRQGITDAVEA